MTKQFFIKRKYLFDNRISSKNIHDCHGDLHTGNIVISKKAIYIFDCIEFNKRFRFCDSASDIGFLSNFYKSYRAYDRGKVNSYNLNNNINKKVYNNYIKQAKKYFELSKYYTSLFEIELKRNKPLLIIICGLTGTGKSTLSMKISIDYDAEIINSDIIRKKNAKINIYQRQNNEINAGLYSYKNTLKTYKKVIEHARKLLINNENVVIDATFQKNEYRKLIDDISIKFGITPIFIQCTAPDDIVKNWLQERLKTKTVSDGRWEVYQHQKKNFDTFLGRKNQLVIDMSKDSFEERKEILNSILLKVNEVLI